MEPDAFIRKISHDLRAPLRALMELPKWVIEDLEAGDHIISDDLKNTLHAMRVQSNRLDLIIAGLSEYALLKAETTGPAECAIEDVLSAVSLPLGFRCDLDVKTLPMAPEHALRIIEILIENAERHGAASTVPAALVLTRVQNGVLLCVSDNGPGIDPKYLGSIFEPLATLKSRDVCEGSGMGLAVIARLAELYGGWCDARPNETGTGLTVRVWVPDPAASA